MTRNELIAKFGLQLGFLLHAGKSKETTLEHLVQIAEEYANSRELAVRKELDFTGENEDTYNELEGRCPECLNRCWNDELQQFGGLCETCSYEGGEQ